MSFLMLVINTRNIYIYIYDRQVAVSVTTYTIE